MESFVIGDHNAGSPGVIGVRRGGAFTYFGIAPPGELELAEEQRAAQAAEAAKGTMRGE